ncbi:MAG: hypothetical protein LKE30_01215 [Bacteroidales bacterium]|jgi:hypothetical protein|nr:hypothetical protein [Bacteroidales bacterium]
MKKFALILIVVLFCVINSNAQDRHRLSNGQPYDVFLSVKGHFLKPLSNLSDNYKWGAGGNISVEYQYQEIKLSWGFSLGYDRFQPKTLKRQFLPTKQTFVAQQAPFVVFVNYYFFNEKVKPYIGCGFGAMWGKYDYSFSNTANINEYYNRDYEGQSGFHFGVLPHVGLMISTNHRDGFGIEFGLENYFKNDRLEKLSTFSATLNYTYIID